MIRDQALVRDEEGELVEFQGCGRPGCNCTEGLKEGQELIPVYGPKEKWPLGLKMTYGLFNFANRNFLAGRKRGLNAKEIATFNALAQDL